MANLQTAVFGGGCFWCLEAAFSRLAGVKSVESGYMGGQLENPTYKQVCTGTTGHANSTGGGAVAPVPPPAPPPPPPPVASVITPEERRQTLARIVADTTAAGGAVRKCGGRKLLPDQESVFDTARSLLGQARDALVKDELWRAESLARKARQLAASLNCPG